MKNLTEIKNYFLNKKIEINVNWAVVIFFFIFFTYGFFGVISKFNNLIFTLITIINLCFFYFLIKNYSKIYTRRINIYYYNFFNFLTFFIFLIIINWNFLNLSLFGDELAHTIRSSRLSIYGLYTIFENLNYEFFYDYKFRNLVNVINFFLLIFIFITIFLLKYISDFKVLLLFLFLTIFFRLFLKDLGMHPPLDHIFTFFTISVFGISDFTSNISYLLGFTIIQLYIFNILYKRFSYALSYLGTISIFTIPLLLSMSTWTESSIWSSLFLTIILLEIYFSKEIDYVKIVTLISIATLFRITVFITLIPLLIFYIYDFFKIKNKKLNLKNIKEEILIFFPILLFLPFLINNLIFGTPSFEINNELNLIEKIFEAVKLNIIWNTIFINIPIWWYLLLPLPFIFKGNKKFTRIIFLIYFMFSILTYFSIDKSLWGLAKYPADYALPFCILGFVIFIVYLKKKNLNENLIGLAFVLLITINILNYKSIYKNYPKQDEIIDDYRERIFDKDTKLKLFNYELIYNLKEMFDYLKSNGMETNTLIVGTTYGFLPEIMNGYSVKEILQVRKNNIYQKKISNKNDLSFYEYITHNKNIMNIILLDISKIQEKIEIFKNNNWYIKKTFVNSEYGSTIYLLTKSE
tara:strand:+ start:3755 stop:5659 length:1905 start_codon:yes stop_codon:yes gene_type:complete